MNIRSRLWFSTIISLLVALAVATALFIGLRSLQATQGQETKAVEINRAISQMHFLTFEALLHPESRLTEQWQLKYNDLAQMLATFSPRLPEGKVLLTNIQHIHAQIKPLFDSLISSYTDPVYVSNLAAGAAVRERLGTQILLKQQEKITAATELVTINQEKLRSDQTLLTWIVAGVLLVLLALVALNSSLVVAAITQGFSRLHKGVVEIASGVLSYRFRWASEKNEFGELARAFNDMTTRLEQVDATKSQFMTVTAHQLRTPLAVTRWNLEALLTKQFGHLSPDHQRALAKAYEATGKINERINDVLLAIAIHEGKVVLQKKETDMRALAEGLLAEAKKAAAHKKIAVKAEYGDNLPVVAVDAELMKKAVRTVLDNAIGYTPEKGKVTVRLNRLRTQGVRLEVEDTGIGIPSKEQINIFGLFTRASNAFLAQPDGSGVGLYIAQGVVRAHGGKIGFKSEEGKGSLFWMELSS